MTRAADIHYITCRPVSQSIEVCKISKGYSLVGAGQLIVVVLPQG